VESYYSLYTNLFELILTERMVHLDSLLKFEMSDTKQLTIHIGQIILAKDGTVHSINWLDRLIQISGVFCDLYNWTNVLVI